MAAATYFFLTIEHKRVVCKYDGTHGGKITRFINDLDDLGNFMTSKASEAGVTLAGLTVQCSSSLDFPRDDDVDDETVALCNAIRGNTVE